MGDKPVTSPTPPRFPTTVTALTTAGLAGRTAFRNDDVAYAAVTRFNLFRPRRGRSPDEPIEQEDDDWCARRVDAFDAYCLPALLKQQVLPHVWFIVFHEVTPPSIVELIERLRNWPWIVPLFASRDQGFKRWGEVLVPALRQFAAEQGKQVVCSCRLDSDDSLHPLWFAMLDHVIETRRAENDWDDTFCINLASGVVRDQGRMLLAQIPRNQFQAVVEPAARAAGPYRVVHTEIDQLMPVYEVLNSYPLWMYHRHDANLSPQRIRGHFEIDDPATQGRLLEEFGLTLLQLLEGASKLPVPPESLPR